MTVADYDAAIAEAEEQKKNCMDSADIIAGMELDMANCCGELNCVAKNVANGLIIDGIPKGGNVANMAYEIKTLRANLISNWSELNTQVRKLELKIEQLKKERAALIESLKEKENKPWYTFWN